MNSKSKGNRFEREICTKLSLWWTNGERSDIFWRVQDSGSRATTRGKKGLGTKGKYGDVMAMDPIGQPLLDLVTIELKSGYNKDTIQDLLDKPEKAAKQTWEKWIEKAEADSKAAGSYSWMIIARRDRRRTLAIFPGNLWDLVRLEIDVALFIFSRLVCWEVSRNNPLCLTTLNGIFEKISPEDVLTWHKDRIKAFGEA